MGCWCSTYWFNLLCYNAGPKSFVLLMSMSISDWEVLKNQRPNKIRITINIIITIIIIIIIHPACPRHWANMSQPFGPPPPYLSHLKMVPPAVGSGTVLVVPTLDLERLEGAKGIGRPPGLPPIPLVCLDWLASLLPGTFTAHRNLVLSKSRSWHPGRLL